MNIVLLGRPGSGKGTQGERLAAALELTHLSTGDLLRHAIAEDSALGRSVRATMGAGGLVDDDTVAALLTYAVGDAPHGFVLDGFPRTLAQCEMLPSIFGPSAIGLAIEIDVPSVVILDRLFARGRADDEPEAVLRRLWEYDRATRVVTDWFERQALLERVDGDAPADEVAAEVLRIATNWFERTEAPA